MPGPAGPVCKDSNTIIRYHSAEDFQNSQVLLLKDGGNLTWGGKLNSYSVFYYISIFRTDVNGDITWTTKLLPQAGMYITSCDMLELNNGGFLLSGLVAVGLDQPASYIFTASVNNNGILLWSHFYQVSLTGGSANGYPYIAGVPSTDALGNIYTVCTITDIFPDRNGVSVVSKLGQDGTPLWNKAFVLPKKNTPLGAASPIFYRVFVSNDSLTFLSSSGSQITYVNMQLSASDASVLMLKAFTPSNYLVPPGGTEVEKFNTGYAFTGGHQSGTLDLSGVDFVTVVFNQALDPVKSFQVQTFPVNYANGWGGVGKNAIVSDDGDLMYGISRGQENSLYYGRVDQQGNILTQKRIQYANPADGNFFLPPLSYFTANKLFIHTTNCASPTGDCGLDYLSFDRNITETSDCIVSSDTSFMHLIPFTLKPAPFQWDYTEDDVLKEIPAQLTQENTGFTKEEICKRVSVCSRPVITGKETICGYERETVFTAHKDAECLSKLSWSLDTQSLKSFRIIDDTTIALVFKNTWKGYLHASVEAACDLRDSFLVNVFSNPVVDLGDRDFLCEGSNLLLNAGNGFRSYTWQDQSTGESYHVGQPGKYWVQVEDQNGCLGSDTVTISHVYQPPAGSRLKDTAVCPFESITLNPGYDPNWLYEWSDGSRQPVLNVNSPGKYWIRVTDSNGCQTSDTATVAAKDCPNHIFFPNAFTPNGDARNDNFSPRVEGNIVKYEFSIYNRWGQMVFHSTRPGESWNGNYNGTAQPSGAFIWTCRYQFLGEDEKANRGSFVLIR